MTIYPNFAILKMPPLALKNDVFYNSYLCKSY